MAQLNLKMGIEDNLLDSPISVGTVSFAADSKVCFIDTLNPKDTTAPVRLPVYSERAYGLQLGNGTSLGADSFMVKNNPIGTGKFTLNIDSSSSDDTVFSIINPLIIDPEEDPIKLNMEKDGSIYSNGSLIFNRIKANENIYVGNKEVATKSYVSTSYLPLKGGTINGVLKVGAALTTNDLKINNIENFNNVYLKKNLGELPIESYVNLDLSEEDRRTHHRIWTLRLPSTIAFEGKIKVTLQGGTLPEYNQVDSPPYDTISKTIFCSFQGSEIVMNSGYYSEIAPNAADNFRISELIYNDSKKCWEIRIWQNHLTSDSQPFVLIEVWSYSPTLARMSEIAKPGGQELTQMTGYTVVENNKPGYAEVTHHVYWADLPVLQNSNGKEIATTDFVNNKIEEKLQDIATDVWAAGANPPSNTKLLWIDTAPTTGGLKCYDTESSQWVHVPVAWR